MLLETPGLPLQDLRHPGLPIFSDLEVHLRVSFWILYTVDDDIYIYIYIYVLHYLKDPETMGIRVCVWDLP